MWERPTGRVDDPWAWMADTTDPDFRGYVDAENAHTERWFAPHESQVEDLYQEIRSRVQETDTSVPVAYGNWWYVSRTVEGSSYAIHRRGPTAEGADEELVLDENVEAEGHDLFELGALDVSPDHSLLAWSADTTGDEHHTLRIRDLAGGQDRTDRIDDVANAGVAWSHDARFVFYVRADDRERPCEVWRHRVGTAAGADVLVWREDDDRFHATIGTTRSQRWVIIHAESATSSECWLLPTDEPCDEPRVVFPRRPGVEYLVDHWGDRFLALTNDGAIDFRVLQATDPWTGEWTELVASVEGRRIVSIDPFEHHLVLHEWADAQPRLRHVDRGGSESVLDLGTAPHDVEPAANPEWATTTLRFRTHALGQPPTDWEEDLRDGERTLLRRAPTPNVDLDAYVSTREWAVADDGERIPLDIVHHRDTTLDGTAPGLLYGYGAYEASIAPWFSVARLSLLDRGWVWALAHPRGGGEKGRRWYLEGKLSSKPNTFSDTEACARQLHESSLVAPGRLAIRGRSAGGLLVGACTVRTPSAYAAVVAEVPFVDLVNTMSDDSLPLTAVEREEWGDPRVEADARLMESYSPYDNTAPGAYPAMYVTGGLNDPRVGAHEPAKWVARLRSVHTGDNPILLRTETGAGHFGPSDRYTAWRDEARVLAFLLATV